MLSGSMVHVYWFFLFISGYLTMTDGWFSEFVLEVVVNKKMLDQATLDILKQEPVVLPAWDPMGALAKCWLTFCTSGLLQQNVELMILFFPKNTIWHFMQIISYWGSLHADCLLWRQFAWNVRSYFLGKYFKMSAEMFTLDAKELRTKP